VLSKTESMGHPNADVRQARKKESQKPQVQNRHLGQPGDATGIGNLI